jgi:CubicO group peptidase (beta-lactamase class C family)
MFKEREIIELVENAIKDKVFPGCSLGIITTTGAEIHNFGKFTYENNSKNVDDITIYDVASITKMVSTGFLCMQALRDGKISLEDKIQKYFPQFQSEVAAIKHLLSYTLNYQNFTDDEKKRLIAEMPVEEFMQGVFKLRLESEPGTVYKYSDATADIQGMLLEKVYGTNLNNLFKKYIVPKYDFVNTTLDPKDLNIENIVPSQVLGGKDLQGLVNDPKARKKYLAGYYSGCAGLFSNVSDLLRVCKHILENRNEYKLMTEDVFDLNVPTPLCSGDNSTTDLRRMLECVDVNTLARNFKRKILGKSGFTGCQLLVDFDRELALVFLSNRTYPDPARDYPKFHEFRRRLVSVLLG